MDNRLISRIAREGGAKLLNMAVDALLPARPGSVSEGKPVKPKRSVTGAIAGAALTRIATRSVPGAILIGGGLLAKTLYDRKQARKATETVAGPTRPSGDDTDGEA